MLELTKLGKEKKRLSQSDVLKEKISEKESKVSEFTDQLDAKRRKWRNAMVLDLQMFCCQEFVTQEEIIFNSQISWIVRIVWFSICVFLFIYVVIVAQGYRVPLHKIASPIVSVNSDYAYFFDMDDINSEKYWDTNTQPDPSWCLDANFYIPDILLPDKHYLASNIQSMYDLAPFSAISSCLSPMKSAEFVTHTKSPVLQIPTSITEMMTTRTSRYSTLAYDTTARTFENHSRAYFLTGVDFATLSVDFFADNWEAQSSSALYDGWSPSFDVRLMNNHAEIVRGCPKYPNSNSENNTYFSGVTSNDFSDGDECVWSGTTAGRITMNLHNVLSAAELDLNQDNTQWKATVDNLVSGMSSYNDLDGDAAEYPYRLSGVTLLMNIEIANSCAGPRTFLDANSAYDLTNQFQSDCMVSTMPPMADAVTIHANITVTKINDYGVIKKLLMEQESGSPKFQQHNGVNIIVQISGDLYTTDSYLSPHVLPQLVILLVVFNIGVALINVLVTSTWCCLCCRATNCCNADREEAYWSSMKEESGRDVDPSGMRFWTKESQQLYRQLHLQTGDQHLFRKLNPEPLWVTRDRKGRSTLWSDYGYRDVPGDLQDVSDAIAAYDELREDFSDLVHADVKRGDLDIVEDWLIDKRSSDSSDGRSESRKRKNRDFHELQNKMKCRLESKIEALKLLTADPSEHQNMMRLMIIEMFKAIEPIVKRKLRVKAMQRAMKREAQARGVQTISRGVGNRLRDEKKGGAGVGGKRGGSKRDSRKEFL